MALHRDNAGSRCARPVAPALRQGQSTVEYLLLISVVVVAIVAAGYFLVPSVRSGMQSMSNGAANAYVDPSRAP